MAAKLTPAHYKIATRKRPRSTFRKRASAALRKFLKSRRLSRDRFALIVGVTERTVRDWCSGRRPLSLEPIGDSELGLHFLRCLVLEERKAWLR